MTGKPGAVAAALVRGLVVQFGESPYNINNGLCDRFASQLWEELPGSRVRFSTEFEGEWPEIPGHLWVEYQGRHYDAEAPDGVAAWRDLPIFKKARAAVVKAEGKA